jgi:hypothetical protein
MQISPTSADAAVNGMAITRIVVGSENIEFLDQPFAIAYDVDTRSAATELSATAAFLLAKLADVWGLTVEVPTELPPPDFGVETIPHIIWPEEKGNPAEVDDYDGPTITVKIGDAVRALGVLANMVRAGTLPSPPEG